MIVLEDVPNFDFDPMARIQTAQIPARRALTNLVGMRRDWRLPNSPDDGDEHKSDSGIDPGFGPNNGDAAANEATAKALGQAVPRVEGVELVDLKPGLCKDNDHCLFIGDGRPLYFDSGH